MIRHRFTAGLSTFTVVLAVATVLFAGPSTADSALPANFNVEVNAAPMQGVVGVSTAFPLKVGYGAAYSSISLASQPLIVAQAAPVYAPLGQTLSNAAPPLPAAPWCFSYFPGEPRQATCGGAAPDAPITVDAAGGRTSSDGDFDDPSKLRSDASVRTTGVSTGSSIPATVHARSASSAVRAGPEAAKVVGAASTELTDVDIAGVLQIRSIRSHLTGSLGGAPGTTSYDSAIVVAGATIAGQPVTIGPDGVTVAGEHAGSEAGPPQAAVDEALGAAGLRVVLDPGAEPTASDAGTSLKASSGSLVVAFDDESGAVASVVLGRSTLYLAASGVTGAPDAVDPVAVLSDTTQDAPAETRPAVVASHDGVTSSATMTSGEAPLPPEPGVGAPPPRGGKPRVLFDRATSTSLDDLRWHWLLVPFTFLVLGVPVLVVARRLTFLHY